MSTQKVNIKNEPHMPDDGKLEQLAFYLSLTEKYGSHISSPLERLAYIQEPLKKAYIAVFDSHPNCPNEMRERFMMAVWPTGINNFEVHDFMDAGDIGCVVRNGEIVRLAR